LNRVILCLALTLLAVGCSSEDTPPPPGGDVQVGLDGSGDVDGGLEVGPTGDVDVLGDGDVAEEIFVPPPECTSAADCDDGNPCTADTCAASGCAYSEDDGASCDDGDACTVEDGCAAGACAGTLRVCDDKNDCTIDWCVAGECKAAPDETDACALNIKVNDPIRASTKTGAGPFYVQGLVVSPASSPTLTINDAAAPLSFDGSFNVLFEPEIGVNIIDVEAMDDYGRTTDVALSFMYAPALIEPSDDALTPDLHGGLASFFLDQEAFDDDDLDDLDDIGTVIWLFGENYDINSALPHPLVSEEEGLGALWCDYEVDVTNLQYSVEDVEMDLVSGGADLSLILTNFSGYVEALSDGWGNFACPNAECDLKADIVYLDAQLEVFASPSGEIQFTLTSVNVDIVLPANDEGVICTGGTASLLNWLIDWFETGLAERMEEHLETWAVDELVPMVNGLVAQFTDYQVSFEVPSFKDQYPQLPMTLRVAPQGATLSDGEADVGLKLGVSAAHAVPFTTPGSIQRSGCNKQLSEVVSPPKLSVAEAYVHEDLINHFLYVIWRGGLGKLQLNDAIIGPYLNDLGVTNVDLEATLSLPPVITTCTSNGALEIQFGDVYAEGSFDYAGGPVSLKGYASARGEVIFTIVDVPEGPNQLGFELVDVLQMAVDIQEIEGMDEAAEDLIGALLSESMLDLLINDYLSAVSQAYPIPSVDLNTWLSALNLAKSKLTFEMETLEMENGHLIVGGKVLND
jgi:hypothetical protein